MRLWALPLPTPIIHPAILCYATKYAKGTEGCCESPLGTPQRLVLPHHTADGYIVPAVRAHHRAYRPNLMPSGIVRQDGKSSGMVSCTVQKPTVCTVQIEPGLALRAARQGVKGLAPATFGSFPSLGKELLGLGGRSHTGIDYCHKDVVRGVKIRRHGRFVNRPYNVCHRHRACGKRRTANRRPYNGIVPTVDGCRDAHCASACRVPP